MLLFFLQQIMSLCALHTVFKCGWSVSCLYNSVLVFVGVFLCDLAAVLLMSFNSRLLIATKLMQLTISILLYLLSNQWLHWFIWKLKWCQAKVWDMMLLSLACFTTRCRCCFTFHSLKYICASFQGIAFRHQGLNWILLSYIFFISQ